MGVSPQMKSLWQCESHLAVHPFNKISNTICLYTYLRTCSMDQSPSWETNRFQLVNKFPAFYGTRRFITAFTSARHLSLSWASSIQSITPQPTSWRSSILILSSNLRLGLPSGLFHRGFPTKTLYTPLPPPSHAHLILDFITRTVLGEEYRTLSSSLCTFLHFSLTSSLLGPNILLKILFSNTLSLRSSLNVSDQVSQPYKTTGKIIDLYILIFKFFDNMPL